MNVNRLPGLRGEDEFNREYKALSQLIGNLEERSEAITMDKKRETENKKVDLFDVNKSISNQIQETNRELEKKLQTNIGYLDELETNVTSLKKNTNKMVSEYKKAINDLATKKTNDLIDSKLKDQLNAAKNLFFKKVLREIVVGNDKGQEVVKVLETKLMMKDKLLKKALLGAEHFRVAIEKVENKYDNMKSTFSDFLRKLNNALAFGHVRVSEELDNINSRKLFVGRDFRSDPNIRSTLGLKDKMMVIEGEKFNFYDDVGTPEPKNSYSFQDVKEIVILKEEPELNSNNSGKDGPRIGTVFFIRFKNDRGGIMVEPEWTCIQKWDYIFFLINIILLNNLTNSTNFKALTLESNSTKLQKQIQIKQLDPITVKKHTMHPYSYPISEISILDNVEDTLIDWEILEASSLRENDILFKKALERNKMLKFENDVNDKSTQTEMEKLNELTLERYGSPSKEKRSGFGNSPVRSDRQFDINYSINSIHDFDEMDNINRSTMV